MGREKADGGFVLYSEVDSEQRPRFLFFRSGDGVGRFHQRAKGVAADFSERGGGRERLRLPRKIWAETGCRWTGKERERERRNGKKEGRMNEWRERTTQREREKERGKKKISPRGGRGDWHSRLVKLRWPRMENEVFDHAWKGDGRAEWSEREREQLSGMVGQFKRKIQKVN